MATTIAPRPSATDAAFAASLADDAADALFGLDALTVQRARLHKIAVEEWTDEDAF